jgi:hypothetical protein
LGNPRARRIPERPVEDEDYQVRYERVAGIDMAQAKADVSTRLPVGCTQLIEALYLDDLHADARHG